MNFVPLLSSFFSFRSLLNELLEQDKVFRPSIKYQLALKWIEDEVEVLLASMGTRVVRFNDQFQLKS